MVQKKKGMTMKKKEPKMSLADRWNCMTPKQRREYNEEKKDRYLKRKFAFKRNKLSLRKDEMKDTGGWQNIIKPTEVMTLEQAERLEKRRQEEKEYVLSLQKEGV